MPTHSYCYPNPAGEAPLFDARVTRSVVGTITETFRKIPGVQRSIHPTHALSALGPAAAALVEGHQSCETPCGQQTPYERLIADDATVLMFGVTLDAYTFFHTAEDAAAVPYLYESSPATLRYLDVDRREHPLTMRRHDMGVARRFSEKDTWLESRGLLRRLRLGRGELLVIPHARQAHDAIVSELRRDPWFLAVPASR